MKLNLRNSFNGIWFFIKNNPPLVVLLLAGFLIRLYGIYFDYPRVDFIWDEIYNVGYLFDLLEQKRIFVYPPSSTYPLVLPILLAPVFVLRLIYIALINGLYSVTALKNQIIEFGIGEVYIISRWYSVLFGTLTILLVYKISELLFKRKISSYFASAVYAFSVVPVFISHWGKHHAVMEFFVVLSLYNILRFEKEKKLKYFYWSLAGAVLAFSTHYVGMSAFIFPLFAMIRNHKLFNFKILSKSFLLAASATLFLYLANYYGIKKMIFDQVLAGYYSKNGLALFPVGFFERYYYVFRDYFMIDPVFTAVFIILIVFLFSRLVKDRFFQYILVGLAFTYLLMITVMTGPLNTRWLLTYMTLTVPFFAGLLIEYLFEKKLNKNIISLIAVVLIIPSVYLSIKWDLALRNDTRVEAEKWVLSNVKPGEKIYSFFYTFYAPMSYEAAIWNKENNDMGFRKINYIIDHQDYFNGKGVNLMYDRQNERYRDLAGKDTKYIMIVSPQTDGGKKIIENLRLYHTIKLIKSFEPSSNKKAINISGFDILNNPNSLKGIIYTDKAGPFLEIYEVVD